jgi:hypothetical protein
VENTGYTADGGAAAIGETLIENFNVGEDRLGTVRVLSFADLTISRDATHSTLSYNGDRLARLDGVLNLAASDVVGL